MSTELIFELGPEKKIKWIYYGYSELIEILEPGPDESVVINESFTIEDFEKAYLEYNKLIRFINALEDIKIKKYMWSKEELKEMSKYNLNCSVLEWLKIREPKKNKEIKEILSLDSFNYNYIKQNKINLPECVLVYYLIDGKNENKFFVACKYGSLEVVQWLYNLGDINIHKEDEQSFKMACKYGNFKVAQWLYSLRAYQRCYITYSFSEACRNGSLEVAQWLLSLHEKIISLDRDCRDVILGACGHNRLEVAKWLSSLKFVDIHIDRDGPLRMACLVGNLEMAKWFFSLYGGSSSVIYCKYTFKKTCEYGRLDVAQWLYSLGGVDKSEIKDIDLSIIKNPKIKEWLDTLP